MTSPATRWPTPEQRPDDVSVLERMRAQLTAEYRTLMDQQARAARLAQIEEEMYAVDRALNAAVKAP